MEPTRRGREGRPERLAKPLIEQLGFEDEVDMRAEGGALGGERLLDEGIGTRFDAAEWEWR